MAKRIKWRLGDSCDLQTSLSNITGIPGLTVNIDGQVDVPSDTGTHDRGRLLKALMDIEGQQATWIRFQFGRQVNELPNMEHGDRLAFCIQELGEQRARQGMAWAWVARKWAWNQNVGWSWSFYRESANSARFDQQRYIAMWQTNRLSLDDLKADCKRMRDEAKNSLGNFSEGRKPSDSTIDANTIYVESASGRYVPLLTEKKWIQIEGQFDEEVEANVVTKGTLNLLLFDDED